jgi:hypothetical protein
MTASLITAPSGVAFPFVLFTYGRFVYGLVFAGFAVDGLMVAGFVFTVSKVVGFCSRGLCS